jgi:hypothetical protein
LPIPRNNRFRRDKDITSYVVRKLYLVPLLHSHATEILEVFADTSFSKKSVPWICFEGRMRFLKELEVGLGGNSFLFLPGFHNAFLSMKDSDGRVSQAVEVFVIQKLRSHFLSNVSVFRKMLLYHQAAFRILSENAQPSLCQEGKLHDNAVPFSSERSDPHPMVLPASHSATIHTITSSTISASSEYSRFFLDTSNGSPYNILLQISLYAYVYSCGKSLRNRTLFPNATWIRDGHIRLYEICPGTETPVHHDRLVPQRKRGRSMAMLVGKLPTREETNTAHRDAVGRRVLSNIMAYRTGYFVCNCLEAWDFFKSPLQIQNTLKAREHCTGMEAKLNNYAYGSMTAKKPDRLHQNILLYFDIRESEIDPQFASAPPKYSRIRSFLQSSKQKVTVQGREKKADRFPIARGPLLSALITSDFANLGWCQLPSASEWNYLFGSGAGKGPKLLYIDPDKLHDKLPRDHWETAAENLLKRLESYHRDNIHKELNLDRIYLEHAMCKVSRFHNKKRNWLAFLAK